MSFPKYPEYKDSGVEWLGEIPAHWVVGPLRWYATIQGGVAKGKSYSGDTLTVDLPYLRVANVQDGHVDLSSVNTVTVALSEVDRYRLQPGDVLMNEGGDNDKLGRGTVWEGEIADCLHQNHVFAIRPNPHLLPYWLSMFTRSSAARPYFYLYSKQSTNLASISSSNVMSCLLPLPPTGEQRQILSFLSHETARIDALVEEQQCLIELLKEKRQAVISHAVTKGLDPDVPMKGSGVEWLGEVPAHWEVSRLGWVSRVDSGHPFPAELFGFDGIPVIRMSDMKDGDVSDASIKRVPVESVPDRAFAKIGDLLIGLSGSISNHAVIKDCDLPCAINQRVGVIRGSQGADFLRYYIQSTSFLEQTAAELEETTIQNISMGQVRSCKVAWPSRDERNHIATFLDHETARIDALMQEGESVINLLQERRSALISAAVTGKIDVRGWQADQQSEQPEILMAAETRATYG